MKQESSFDELFDRDTAGVLAKITTPQAPLHRQRRRHTLSGLGVVAMACFGADAGQAQTAPVQQAASSGNNLEEVTVTAQKTREDLQKSALAITSLSDQTLDKTNATSVLDLDTHLPGVLINVAGTNPLAVTVRGAGYEGLQNNSAQPSVSFTENGVYIASTFALTADFLDVDRLELLRGPQGTVLGQNSDGGAFNLTTVQPSLDGFNGKADFSYGSYNLIRTRVAANVPVGDTAAVRVALQQEQHDGWSVATKIPGQPDFPLSDEDSITGRITGLWAPTDALTFHAWVEHYQDWADGAAVKNIFDPDPDPRRLTQDFPSKLYVRSDIAAADGAYNFGFATLKAITSYQFIRANTPEDVDKVDFATGIKLYGEHDVAPGYTRLGNAYTEEIDLTSAPGGLIDWIGGVFLLHQRNNETFIEYQQSVAGLPTPADALDFTGAEIGTYFADQGSFIARDTEVRTSVSAYGQGTYHITDALRFTGGARATHDMETADVAVYFNPAVHLATKFGSVTGKADVEFDVTPENMVYALWSSGVKPGGTNLNPGSTVIPTAFRPESVSAFEVGSKNQFFDRKARVNIAAYYNMISNYQIESEDPIPFKGGQTSIDSVDTWGIETEGSAILPYDLRMDGNFSLSGGQVESHNVFLDPVVAQAANAKYGIFTPADLAARLAGSEDVYGKTPGKLPPFSMSLSLTHTLHLGDSGTLQSTVQFSYRTSYYFRVYDNPATDIVPDSRQWNLHFDYEPPSGGWHAEFLVLNLTDGASPNSRFADNFGSGEIQTLYIPPRQFIARVGVEF